MIGLKVEFCWYEFGGADFFNGFFSTVCYHLENRKWGSKYPYLLNHLYFGKLVYKDVPKALKELKDIREKLAAYAISEVIPNVNDISIKPKWRTWNPGSPKVTNLSNCFITCNGYDIFEVFFSAFDYSIKYNQDVVIECYGDNDYITKLNLSNDGMSVMDNSGKANFTGLDWGAATPELYNAEKKTAVHVFNHNLIGNQNVDRCIRFAIGRLKWYKGYLPEGCTQEVVFDDRGQNLDKNAKKILRERLSVLTEKIKFMSER